MSAFQSIALALAIAASLAAPSDPGRQDGVPPPAASGELVVTVPQFPNPSCPIMGKPISDKLWVDLDQGRIYICCKACIKKIVAAPDAAYRTAYPKLEKVGNKLCPITGKQIEADSPTVILQGRQFAVCCEKCPTIARASAQVVLAKVMNPKLVDVGNATCPISGDAVDPNAFCVIGEKLVHLSSTDHVEAVKKDPKAALAKAIELAAKRSAQ